VCTRKRWLNIQTRRNMRSHSPIALDETSRTMFSVFRYLFFRRAAIILIVIPIHFDLFFSRFHKHFFTLPVACCSGSHSLFKHVLFCSVAFPCHRHGISLCINQPSPYLSEPFHFFATEVLLANLCSTRLHLDTAPGDCFCVCHSKSLT
jgi:hypothetical protein